jgi:hypothetical protein
MDNGTKVIYKGMLYRVISVKGMFGKTVDLMLTGNTTGQLVRGVKKKEVKVASC